jgi:hypothetical protein
MTKYFAFAAKAIKYYCQKQETRIQKIIYLPSTKTEDWGRNNREPVAVGRTGYKNLG